MGTLFVGQRTRSGPPHLCKTRHGVGDLRYLALAQFESDSYGLLRETYAE
jgi:hypothetical protein